MKIKYLLTTGFALTLAACGDAGEEPVTADPTAMVDEQPVDTATPDAATMPTTAQGFVDMAASSDMYEIQAGQLAQQNGTSQAVKDFGAMMERDHTKSSNDMKAAAAQADGVTVPTALMAKHQTLLDALRNAGDNFDSLYKTQQIGAHEEALALLENYAENGDSEPLKAFARQTAPVVEGHLEQVRGMR